MQNAHRHLRERVSRGLKCVFLCRNRANLIRGEARAPRIGNAGFSYPIRCEPIPLAAPDHLSNLVPSTFHLAWDDEYPLIHLHDL
jgi:hypothetical protein